MSFDKNENHENHRIQCHINENHENQRIPCENLENHENIKIPQDNYEKTLKYYKSTGESRKS